MKKKAGKDNRTLSFNFIRTANPQNISRESPKDATDKIGLYINPTNNPVAPKNSRTMVRRPIFSKLNRLNSFFMWGDMK